MKHLFKIFSLLLFSLTMIGVGYWAKGTLEPTIEPALVAGVAAEEGEGNKEEKERATQTERQVVIEEAPGTFDPMELITHTMTIEDILEGEAAEAAGLQVGDQLLALNGVEAETESIFIEELHSHSPGDQVTLTILRNGETQDVELTLGDNGSGQAFLGIGLGVEVEATVEMEGDFPFDHLPDGFDEKWFDEDNSHFPPDTEGATLHGALIGEVEAGGAAEQAGLQQGDIITAVNGAELDEFDTLTNILAEYAPGDTLTLTVQQDEEGEPRELDVTLGANDNGDAKLGARVGFVIVRQHDEGGQSNHSREEYFIDE